MESSGTPASTDSSRSPFPQPVPSKLHEPPTNETSRTAQHTHPPAKMSKEETPILPQAAAFLVISYLVYRFFFTSPPAASSTPPAVPPAATRRRLQQQIEVVHGMFPQVPTAAIEAELLRNGGNMEVATERILATGFLPDVSLHLPSPSSQKADGFCRHPATAPPDSSQGRPTVLRFRPCPRRDSWLYVPSVARESPTYRPDHAVQPP
jgi:hypothetical protein